MIALSLFGQSVLGTGSQNFLDFLKVQKVAVRENQKVIPVPHDYGRISDIAESRSCYRNCTLYSLWEDRLTYHEGVARSEGLDLWMPHAWLVSNHNVIYDPTWSLLSKSGEVQKASYYGVAIPKEVVRFHISNGEHYGVLLDDRGQFDPSTVGRFPEIYKDIPDAG